MIKLKLIFVLLLIVSFAGTSSAADTSKPGSSLDQKASPIGLDRVLIIDTEASNAIHSTKIDDLPLSTAATAALALKAETSHHHDGVYLKAEVDGSPTNEIQVISISGNTLTLSNGGGSQTLPTGVTSYNDLTDKPTIPTDNSQLTNGAGYINSYTDSFLLWDKDFDDLINVPLQLPAGCSADELPLFNGTAWGCEEVVDTATAFTGTVLSGSGTLGANIQALADAIDGATPLTEGTGIDITDGKISVTTPLVTSRQWTFDTADMASPTTEPYPNKTYEVHTDVSWDTGKLVCDIDPTAIVIKLATSSSPYGTYTDIGTISSTGSFTVTGYSDLSAGDNVGAYIASATAGSATSCKIIVTMNTK